MGSPKITSPEELIRVYPALKSIGADSENFWLWREDHRFTIGDYLHLPDIVVKKLTEHRSRLASTHYVHISMQYPGMVAFTPDETMGKADRQVRTKFGRYLKNDSGLELSDPAIAELGALLRSQMAPAELQIAESADDMVEVYRQGPRSCMSKGGCEFDYDELKPARVYAAGDIAIAYVEREGSITARCVIRKDNQEYMRVYGDDLLLIEALKKTGYTSGSTLEGCRLRVIEYEDGYIMPFLDGEATQVSLSNKNGKKYFIITDSGDYEATTTSGLVGAEKHTWHCGYCQETADEDEACYVESVKAYVCDGCLNNSFVYAYTGRDQEWLEQASSDIAGSYNHDYYTYDALSFHDLIHIDDEIYLLDDCVVDALTDEYIYVNNATEYLESEGGDTLYTADTDALVFSDELDAHILKADATQNDDGDWVFTQTTLPEDKTNAA